MVGFFMQADPKAVEGAGQEGAMKHGCWKAGLQNVFPHVPLASFLSSKINLAFHFLNCYRAVPSSSSTQSQWFQGIPKSLSFPSPFNFLRFTIYRCDILLLLWYFNSHFFSLVVYLKAREIVYGSSRIQAVCCLQSVSVLRGSFPIQY